jgi:hypothetical protein
LFGPLLQWIDSVFIHRSYRRLDGALAWLVGVIAVYVAWAELVVGPMNGSPAGTVTSGLPYRFLNNLDWADRAVFYASNLVTGILLLFLFSGIAWAVRRRFPVPAGI